MNQVYLLSEIVTAFAAIGRTMVTVDCSRCDQKGRVSLSRLLAEHGPSHRLRD